MLRGRTGWEAELSGTPCPGAPEDGPSAADSPSAVSSAPQSFFGESSFSVRSTGSSPYRLGE